MQPSEEIKSRLDIVDVLREYIALHPAGVNFKAKCPFHRENSPSFIVSPEKQIWHCFGCGKGGDVFAFIMEMEGYTFVEALRALAPKAGVTLRQEDPKAASQRNRLLDILELCRKFYHRCLVESREAAPAREYLEKRGLTPEVIEEWQIGYSPDSWDSVLKALKQKGFTEKEIFLSGMSVQSQRTSSSYYDRFRARVMFPINDINANTVAFSARVRPDKEATEKLGKYINSPQAPIYDKSKILFGLDKAKQAIKSADEAIIVEGQMDVITAHQFGYRNVVASSGTALTEDQVRLLKRYSANLTLCFDQDEAGGMAAERGIREALAQEANIKVIELSGGKDPDECIREDQAAWEKAAAQAKPMMQFHFDRVLSGQDMGPVENRRKFAGHLLPRIAELKNRIERDYWLRVLAEKLDVEEAVLREAMPRQGVRSRARGAEQGRSSQVEPVQRASREERLSELLLALAAKFPSVLEYLVDRLQVEQLAGESNRILYKSFIFYYNNIINSESGNGYFDLSAFQEWFLANENQNINESQEEGQSNNLNRLVILGDEEYYELEDESARSEAIKLFGLLKKAYLAKRMREVENMIAEAERENDEATIESVMQEFQMLSQEFREMGEGI
jgi:DNA primase